MQFIGGRLGALAASGVLVGVFTVLAGATPGQFAARLFQNPPAWVPWVSPALVILGLAIIWASLRFNVWSQKQKAIDSLAEDISQAIHELVNRPGERGVPVSDEEYQKFYGEYKAWIKKVSKKLENRAFFTRADQLHFDRLGYLDDPISLHGDGRMDWVHTQLKLKFKRLRDVINWAQERRR